MEYFGRGAAESMAYCARHRLNLWSDDQAVRSRAFSLFQHQNACWTQAFLASLKAHALMTDQEYESYSAKLVALQYSNALYSAETISQAGLLADWHAEQWPLRQLIEQIGKSDVSDDSAVVLALSTVASAFRSTQSGLRRDGVVRAVLASLRTPRLVKLFRRGLKHAFGVDWPSERLVLSIIDSWHATALIYPLPR